MMRKKRMFFFTTIFSAVFFVCFATFGATNSKKKAHEYSPNASSELYLQALKDNLEKLKPLINNMDPNDATYRASLGIIKSNNFQNAYSGLNQATERPPKTPEAIINNFVATVKLFNDF